MQSFASFAMNIPGAFAALASAGQKLPRDSSDGGDIEQSPSQRSHCAALRAGLDFVLGRAVTSSDLAWLNALVNAADCFFMADESAAATSKNANCSALSFLQAELSTPEFWEQWGPDLNESTRKRLTSGLGLAEIVVPVDSVVGSRDHYVDE
jgi:hypothetical protein